MEERKEKKSLKHLKGIFLISPFPIWIMSIGEKNPSVIPGRAFNNSVGVSFVRRLYVRCSLGKDWNKNTVHIRRMNNVRRKSRYAIFCVKVIFFPTPCSSYLSSSFLWWNDITFFGMSSVFYLFFILPSLISIFICIYLKV